jgi:glycosyltransferase involved in cell wall biosynthesis
MKVTCLIDSLASGGAQRQLCTLAVLLKKHGMDVSMLTYHHYDFFLPMISEAGIAYDCIEGGSLPRRILALRRALRRGGQDVVLAFMEAPSLYAELAAIPNRKWGLVVSERIAMPKKDAGWFRWLWKIHRIADYVTTNSHTNRMMIERAVPCLKGRIVTIYNAVDLETFSPPAGHPAANEHCISMITAASFKEQKNPLGLIEALSIVRQRMPSLDIHLDWYGGLPNHKDGTTDYTLYNKSVALVEKKGLQERIRFHPPSARIRDLYRETDAVVLPSFFEGLPNVVCEAMACGRPVLASDVCDTGNLVKDGYNGFVFDPASPNDMAEAVMRFAKLSPAEREAMGQRGREMAQKIFDPSSYVVRYQDILVAAAERKKTPIEHWVPEVPDSAYRSLN